MKNLVFIICFTILIKPIVPVFEYVINYDYISTKLCVNKAKPEMHCNGKCYLMKKLAAAAETEKPASSDKKHTPVIETSDLFFSALANYDVLFIANPFKASLNAGYSDLYHNPIHFSVFHPPIITA